MPETLPIVAQKTMDLYYQSYKSAEQFFDLDDFISQCGATIADMYEQVVRAKYAELRAMRSEDVVSLPADWLLEQRLKVERKDNQTYATLASGVMSFLWDNQVLGIQDVLPVKPADAKLERAAQAASWQTPHVPYTNRTFWYVKKDKIFFQRKSGCNIVEVDVLYIPSIGIDMLVPEGIIRSVMDQTVFSIKNPGQGNIVKKAIDGNPNMAMETEMNKQALK